MNDLPSFLGTLPGWITSGGVVALLTVVLRFLNKRREIDANAVKTRAEADKIEADAGNIALTGLAQEMGRLQERVKQQDAQIKQLRDDADNRISHEAKVEQENRSLRAKVVRMERRISGLEAILKVHPVTPEMQAELDKLEREDLDA